MEDWNCTRCRSRNTDLYKGRRRDKCTSCYLSRDKAKPVPAVVPTVLSKSPGAACVPASGHTTPRRDFRSSNGVTPAAGASGIVNPETHQPRPQHQSLPKSSPQLLPSFSPAVHPSPHQLHQPPPPSHQPQGPPPPQVLAPWMAPLPPPPQAPNTDEGAGVFDYEWTREKAAARQLPPLAVHTTADAAPECAAASRTCGCQPSHTHTHTRWPHASSRPRCAGRRSPRRRRRCSTRRIRTRSSSRPHRPHRPRSYSPCHRPCRRSSSAEPQPP